VAGVGDEPMMCAPDARAGGRAWGWAYRLASPAATLWLLTVTGLAVVATRGQVADLSQFLRYYPGRTAPLVFVPSAVGLAMVLTVAGGLLRPARWRRIVLALAALPVPLLAVTSDNVGAVAAALALLAPACWAGRALVGWALRPVAAAEAWIIGATGGVGLLAALGYALGAAGILRAAAIWSALLLVALPLLLLPTARRQLGTDLAAARRWLAEPVPRGWARPAATGLLVGYAWLNLIGALAPEIMADAVRTRLPIAVHLARTGQLVVPPEFVMFRVARLGEVVYAVALAAGPLQTAKLLNFAIGLLCAAGVAALGRRLGGGDGALVAALAFYSLPLTAWLSQTAYTDLFTTLFAVTAVLALVLHARPSLRALAAAVACIGAGLMVKTSFALAAIGLAIAIAPLAVWRLAAWCRGARFALAALIAGIVLLPALWFARHSAPLRALPGFPAGLAFLTRVWDAGAAQFAEFARFGFGAERSLTGLARSPLEITLHSGRYGENQHGFVGYLLLALVPLLLVAWPGRRAAIPLLAAVAMYLAWFATAQYLRYALPLFAILGALGGAAYAAAGKRGGNRHWRAVMGLPLLALTGFGLFGYLNTIVIYPGAFPYRVAFGQQSKSAYLTEQVRAYAALRLLDAEPDARLALAPREYARLYTRVRLYRTILLRHIGYLIPADERALFQAIDAGGFSHVVVDREDLPPEWETLTVIDEEFLRRNAILVGGDRNAYLYRFAPPDQRGRDQEWAKGGELLPNGGFEELDNSRPAGWRPFGSPRLDSSSRESRSGETAILGTADDGYTIEVPVEPDRRYLLSHATRSAGGSGMASLRISWLDGERRRVGLSEEVVPVGPQGYRLHSLLATAPPGAASAVVYAWVRQGTIWFDDFSLRAVEPDQPAARGAPAGAVAGAPVGPVPADAGRAMIGRTGRPRRCRYPAPPPGLARLRRSRRGSPAASVRPSGAGLLAPDAGGHRGRSL